MGVALEGLLLVWLWWLSRAKTSEGGFRGAGVFNQTGGVHAIAATATLSIASQPGGAGTFNLRGGTLTGGPVVNSGTFNLFANARARSTPPASGETTVMSRRPIESKYSIMTGAANR